MILYGILAFIGGCVVLGMADSKKKGPWEAIGSICLLAGVVMLAIGLLAYPYKWIFGHNVKGIYVWQSGRSEITMILTGDGKAGLISTGGEIGLGAGTYEVDGSTVRIFVEKGTRKFDILRNGDLLEAEREMLFIKKKKK